MASSVPFMNGKDTRAKLVIGGSSIPLDLKSWDVKRNCTKINDGVCGEQRDRLDTITNYFEISFTAWTTKTITTVKRFIADQATDDAGGAPTDKSLGFIFFPRDGSKEAYKLGNLTLDDYKLSGGGRTERVMLDIPLRSQTFESVGGL